LLFISLSSGFGTDFTSAVKGGDDPSRRTLKHFPGQPGNAGQGHHIGRASDGIFFKGILERTPGEGRKGMLI
jgi:hypothetical protein